MISSLTLFPPTQNIDFSPYIEKITCSKTKKLLLKAVIFPCFHVFHKEVIKTKNVCPVCLKGEGKEDKKMQIKAKAVDSLIKAMKKVKFEKPNQYSHFYKWDDQNVIHLFFYPEQIGFLMDSIHFQNNLKSEKSHVEITLTEKNAIQLVQKLIFLGIDNFEKKKSDFISIGKIGQENPSRAHIITLDEKLAEFACWFIENYTINFDAKKALLDFFTINVL